MSSAVANWKASRTEKFPLRGTTMKPVPTPFKLLIVSELAIPKLRYFVVKSPSKMLITVCAAGDWQASEPMLVIVESRPTEVMHIPITKSDADVRETALTVKKNEQTVDKSFSFHKYAIYSVNLLGIIVNEEREVELNAVQKAVLLLTYPPDIVKTS